MSSPGIFRPSEARFYMTNSVAAFPATHYQVYFGIGSDTPVAGDWEGDGRSSPGVYRSNIDRYYLTNSFAPAAPAHYNVPFGGGSDVPLVGTWDG